MFLPSSFWKQSKKSPRERAWRIDRCVFKGKSRFREVLKLTSQINSWEHSINDKTGFPQKQWRQRTVEVSDEIVY